MKKLKYLFALSIFAAVAFPVLFTLFELGVFSSDPKVDIKNKVPDDAPVLRVVADYDFSPYTFFDSNYGISGYDVEIMNEIGNRLGMKISLSTGDWPTCKKAFNNRDADLILGLEIFATIQGALKTIPTSFDDLKIFGKDTINDVSSLQGKKVGIMANNIIDKIYDLNCEYVQFFTNTDIMNAIESGKIDYGVCHAAVAMKIIEKSGLKIYPSVTLMNSYPGIGVRDDMPELRERINRIINSMSKEGLIQKLKEKWIYEFTRNRSLKEVFSNNFRFYVMYSSSFVVVVMLFIFLYLHAAESEKSLNASLDYQKKLQKQYNLLSSISEVYMTMHILDLKNNRISELNSTDTIRKHMKGTENAIQQMRDVMSSIVIPEDLEQALYFTDLTTISDRMRNRKSVSAEFRSVNVGWFCAQFIAVESDSEGNVIDVVFTTQNINDMKKEREMLLKISSRDELTGLFNRRAYEMDLEKIKNGDANVNITVATFDVNGLKQANDLYGHSAGDELICAAAAAIKKSFGSIGKVYRTGGDEFVVFFNNIVPDISNKIRDFKAYISQWQGLEIESMAISVGAASPSEIDEFSVNTFDNLLELADKKMYDDKAAYYSQNGIDRRGQVDAFNAICGMYTKILKINLTNDNYQIVKTVLEEKVEERGFAERISVWLSDFAKSGQVHEEDVAEYLEKTNIENIKKHFLEGNKIFAFKYRRRIGDSFSYVAMEIIPSKDYTEDSQTFYLYVKAL